MEDATDGTKAAFIIENANIPAPREHLAQYMELLQDYHDVISIGKFDLGWTDALQHSIAMEDDDPIHTKQFRIPLEHRQTIYDWVDELVEKGAIETSKSPYNSPIFLVPKPHGQGMRAAYAVYDVHQLRGTLTEVASNQDIITQRMDTCIDDVAHLAEAQATTNNVLRAMDAEVSDLELMVQLTTLERTAAAYCYHTAAAMDDILDQRLTTGLVSEKQLHMGFHKLKQKAWQQGLTPIMDDPKQAYQLQAYFEAKFGQPLRVWVASQ